METNSKIEVYYVARNYGYATNLESIKFSSKENADAFINLMKAEGYEITQFGGEGYLGAEAEQEKRDEKAQDIYAEYQAKIEALAEEGRDTELDVLQEAAGIYEEYLDKICDLYECMAGVGDGFVLDLTCLGDEFFIEPNPDTGAMQVQYDRLYSRMEDICYAMQFEPVAR